MPSCRGSHSRWQRSRRRSPPNAISWRSGPRRKRSATASRGRSTRLPLAKKIKAQLAGLDLLESLTQDLVKLGMGNTNAKIAKQIEDQAKQLANAYLPGAQAALNAYTNLFASEDGKFDADQSTVKREAIYSQALDQLTRLHAIIKQGREYLNKRAADPELAPDTSSTIAAWLGHAWHLSELREAGLVQQNVELIQLAFHTHDSVARGEYVDTGIWMNLGTGKIHSLKRSGLMPQ